MIALFDGTHAVRETPSGRLEYQRIALPAAGGVGDQPARLFELLEVVRLTKNRLLRQAVQAARAQARSGSPDA